MTFVVEGRATVNLEVFCPGPISPRQERYNTEQKVEQGTSDHDGQAFYYLNKSFSLGLLYTHPLYPAE